MICLMKKISILCLGLMLAACTLNKREVPETPKDVKPEPESLSLTFILPEEGEKKEWKAGDQIIVHGEYAKDQVTVTISAEDISTFSSRVAVCRVDGLYPYKNEECASTLYAAWPADAVDNLNHCFWYTRFKATDRQIMAAYNDEGNTFQFQNLCGSISFETGENFSSLTLVGNKKETLGFETMQVMLTDAEQNYAQFMGNPVLMQDCKASAVTTLYFPSGVSFPHGFYIKFRDSKGEFVKSYRTYDEISIERDVNLDLGDISADIEVYDDPFSSDIKDIDDKGNANCYIITEPGKYKFKAVRGNNYTSYLEDAATADILWETWNDESEVTPGSVLTSASYAEDYVIIHTPQTLRPGNAVVAVRDMDGNILWSWHLWVPQTAIQTDAFGGIMGRPLMDRNLGALVAAKAEEATIDPLSYGMVYQWGRKDPFCGPGALNSSTPATCAGEQENPDSGDLQATIGLEESIANPRHITHINNGNWLNENHAYLWEAEDGSKSMFDPCPPGYQVPRKTSDPFWSSFASAEGWAVNAEFFWITMGNPVAVFPIGGYRDDYGIDDFAYVGKRVLYLTSAASDAAKAKGADLRLDKGTYSLGSPAKSRLGYVRCVTE